MGEDCKCDGTGLILAYVRKEVSTPYSFSCTCNMGFTKARLLPAWDEERHGPYYITCKERKDLLMRTEPKGMPGQTVPINIVKDIRDKPV